MSQISISQELADKGLNLQAAFNITDLPAHIVEGLTGHCPDAASYNQVLLLAHGGTQLWRSVQASGIASDHFVDDFSVSVMEAFLNKEHPGSRFTVLYPGPAPIGLRDLGVLAGWHHATPFRVGIHPDWGSWFAYRLVVLADTDYAPTVVPETSSPCDNCVDKPCIDVCPAKAVADDDLNLDQCLDYRLSEDTVCADKCLSRLACPVAHEHRYTPEQMAYHYGRSLAVIRNWKRG